MINVDDFFNQMKKAGISFFTGVPDSLLSNLCAYIDDHSVASDHIISANEGNAVALAAGYYLSSGKGAAVYMQNSGLGNAINPLTSLTDPQVYRIPMLLIIGWRGEPDVKDEPQHIKQGRITIKQLELLEIPYQILDKNTDSTRTLGNALATMAKIQAPVALLVRKDTFSTYKTQRIPRAWSHLTRENALQTLLQLCGDDLVIATTGKTSREVFEIRAQQGHTQSDFLTVGSMGHAASIALGVALNNPHKRIICLDGDGSMLMHMGSLPIIGSQKPANFIHVLLNNAAHESVGGQPTVANQIDFSAIAKACGYRQYARADNATDVQVMWKQLSEKPGPCMLEIAICIGSRDNLGRPTYTPEQNKQAFMQAVQA